MPLETTIRKKYGARSPALKRRFVAACRRRVHAARARVYSQSDRVRKDAIEATIRILGPKTSAGSARVTKAMKACERFADAFENERDGPQQSLMFACLAALELARGDHDDDHVVTNNIDTMIDGYDPEGEAGIEEEQAPRVRILDALARLDEDAVEALVIEAIHGMSDGLRAGKRLKIHLRRRRSSSGSQRSASPAPSRSRSAHLLNRPSPRRPRADSVRLLSRCAQQA